jgi:hypothetical protein
MFICGSEKLLLFGSPLRVAVAAISRMVGVTCLATSVKGLILTRATRSSDWCCLSRPCH